MGNMEVDKHARSKSKPLRRKKDAPPLAPAEPLVEARRRHSDDERSVTEETETNINDKGSWSGYLASLFHLLASVYISVTYVVVDEY